MGPRGAGSTWALGGPYKTSNSQKVKTRRTSSAIYDYVGNNPRCTNQVVRLERSSSTGGVARPCLDPGEYSSEGAEGFKLNQGPLKRSSSLLVRIATEEVINKEEMGWTKF